MFVNFSNRRLQRQPVSVSGDAEILSVAMLAVDLALVLVDAGHLQRLVAAVAGEAARVESPAGGHDFLGVIDLKLTSNKVVMRKISTHFSAASATARRTFALQLFPLHVQIAIARIRRAARAIFRLARWRARIVADPLARAGFASFNLKFELANMVGELE